MKKLFKNRWKNQGEFWRRQRPAPTAVAALIGLGLILSMLWKIPQQMQQRSQEVAQEMADELLLPAAQRLSPQEFQNEMLQQSLRDLRQALTQRKKSFRAWSRSGYRPQDVIQYLYSLEQNQVLCQSLQLLKPKDLAYFQGALAQLPQELLCQAELMQDLQAFWRQQLETLPPAPSLKHLNFTQQGQLLRELSTDLQLEKEFILSFSGGPHPQHTPQILKQLRQAGLQGVFLISLKQAAKQPKLLQKIIEQEQLLGWTFESERKQVPNQNLLKMILKQREIFSRLAKDHMPRLIRLSPHLMNAELDSLLSLESLRPLKSQIRSPSWQSVELVKILADFKQQLDQSSGGVIELPMNDPQTQLILPHLLHELQLREWEQVVLQ